eukprot:ANDGO_02966.mRNA.1 hypothetical protein
MLPGRIETVRLELLSPPPVDSDMFIQSLFSDAEIVKHLPHLNCNSSGGWTLEQVQKRREGQERDFYANRGWSFVARDKHTLEWVGGAGFRTLDVETNLHGEFGIVIAPKFQRCAYGTEIHLAILDLAFSSRVGVHRVEFRTGIENQAMRSFYDKNAVVHEGVFRDFLKLPGGPPTGFLSMAMYSILAHEWPTIRESLHTALDAATPKATSGS